MWPMGFGRFLASNLASGHILAEVSVGKWRYNVLMCLCTDTSNEFLTMLMFVKFLKFSGACIIVTIYKMFIYNDVVYTMLRLEALSMDNTWTSIFIFFLGNPHILEG